MKPHRVIAAFLHQGRRITPPSMWTPPSEEVAARLIRAECLRPPEPGAAEPASAPGAPQPSSAGADPAASAPSGSGSSEPGAAAAPEGSGEQSTPAPEATTESTGEPASAPGAPSRRRRGRRGG